MNKNEPIILAITAASSIIYGIRTLEFLLRSGFKTELIISSKAYYIFQQEMDIEITHDKHVIRERILNYINLQDKCPNLTVWLDNELWGAPASGSYKTQGMIIAPASMATIASIAHGYAENLITRAADVTLKEGRSMVAVPRETPFSTLHLENLLKLSRYNVKIVPPIMGYYGKIKTLEDGINFIVGKILDASGITNDLYERWH